MTWEDEFISDYKNLSENDLYKKYYGKIPSSVTNGSVVARVFSTGAVNCFIDQVWHGDRRDSRTYFLMDLKNGLYEVFQTERGGKHMRTVHGALEAALEAKVDFLLHALGHNPPDAKFYKY